MKLLTKLQSSKEFWFILVTSVFFFLLRLPSLFEPYWYGDEGIYEVIGYALRHGRFLYSGIWDNKPPILYLIYAIFSGNQMAAKSLSLIAGLGAIWAIFFLGKKLFVKFVPAAVATAIFAFLFGIPLIEGNIANAENFMLLPGILAGLLVFSVVKNNNKLLTTNYQLLTAGLFLGLSFLTKVVGLFDFAASAVFIFLISLQSFSLQNIFVTIKKIIPFFIGFIIPLIFCVSFFVVNHTFNTFLHSTLLSNVNYVNYGNKFLIPQGFLILKTFLLALIVFFFLVQRKRIGKEFLFIFLWFAFSFYSSLFSGRPYTHYALVMLPSFSLLIGLFMAEKKKIMVGILIVITILIVNKLFTFYNHSIGYYENFLQYVTGQKTESSYQTFFDKSVPRDYAIAQFLNSHLKPNQQLFLWGNSGQIYKLTNSLPPGRFIVEYHIIQSPETLAETNKVLETNQPSYIVLFPNQETIPFSLFHYQPAINIQNITIYAKVF